MRTFFAFGWLLIAATSAFSQFAAGPLDVIRWSNFQKGSQSQVRDPLARVLVSEADYQTYWARSFGEPPQNAPRGVNWMKEYLVAIHLGERNTGGYEVRVTSMKRTSAAEITIEYSEITPAKGSVNTQAITSPWVIVRMDKTAGNVVFKKTTRAATQGLTIGRKGCGCCIRCTCAMPPPVAVLNPIALDFPNPNRDPYERRVWWREFDQGEFSQIPGFGMTIIRNLSDLGKYWMWHTGQNRTPWDRGAVDWMQEQLVAINVGKTAGSGYRVAVDGVERTRPHEITIWYTVSIPAIPNAVESRVSSPFAIIRMERSTDNLVFVRRNYQPAAYDDCACRCGRCRAH